MFINILLNSDITWDLGLEYFCGTCLPPILFGAWILDKRRPPAWSLSGLGSSIAASWQNSAAAIVSEWVTDRLRWKQLSSRSPVYSPCDSCTCARHYLMRTSEGRRAAKARRERAPPFLERLDGGMTEWQMSRPPSGGISVPLTLIHWHTSVSRRLNAIALIYGPAIDPLTPQSEGIGRLLLLLRLFLFPLPPASWDKP